MFGNGQQSWHHKLLYLDQHSALNFLKVVVQEIERLLLFENVSVCELLNDY